MQRLHFIVLKMDNFKHEQVGLANLLYAHKGITTKTKIQQYLFVLYSCLRRVQTRFRPSNNTKSMLQFGKANLKYI